MAYPLSKTPESPQKVQITELADFSELTEISELGNPEVPPQTSKIPRGFCPYFLVFRELHSFPKLRHFTYEPITYEPITPAHLIPTNLISDYLTYEVLAYMYLTPDILTSHTLTSHILTPDTLLRHNNVCAERLVPKTNFLDIMSITVLTTVCRPCYDIGIVGTHLNN